MLKRQIIKNFMRIPKFEQKEKFMKRNGIRFVYDQYNNVTVWADDGTLQLFPLNN